VPATRSQTVAYMLAVLAVLAASTAAAYSMWLDRLGVHVTVEIGDWSDNIALVATTFCPTCVNITGSNTAVTLKSVNDELTLTVSGEPGTAFCLEAVLKIVNLRCLIGPDCASVTLLEPRLETLNGYTVDTQLLVTEEDYSPDCSSCSLPATYSPVAGTRVEGIEGPNLVIVVKGVTGSDGLYRVRITLPAIAASGG